MTTTTATAAPDLSCPYCGSTEPLESIGPPRVQCPKCGRKFSDPALATVPDKRPKVKAQAEPDTFGKRAKAEAQAKAEADQVADEAQLSGGEVTPSKKPKAKK